MNASDFQTTIQGLSTDLYHLENNHLSCYFTNYGARLVALQVKNHHSGPIDVVLGFKSIQEYFAADEQYHGATVGRFANRIGNGRFTLEGTEYTLAKNNGSSCLHGGIEAFHKKVWDANKVSNSHIKFSLHSEDMEEGFPGALDILVSYQLKGSDLIIHYSGTTTSPTVLNLTHHSYFNLNGEGSGDVLNHKLQLNCSHMTVVNENVIPTGKLAMVDDTPFDFQKAKTIGQDITEKNEQLIIGSGYDHNYAVDHYAKGILNFVAQIKGDQSKMKMEVWSTEPGVQFYSANHLSGKDIGKSGNSYESRHAFCLETQHFPDSPNQENFPSTVLLPEEVYRSTTEYRFSL